MNCLRYLSEFRAVEGFYGDRVAERSKVPLINHIHEGVRILDAIGASQWAIRGFCLHPLFQNDAELLTQATKYLAETPNAYPVMLVMEYRSVANNYLAYRKNPDGTVVNTPKSQLRVSCLKEVNDMLIADKVQNRKDFEAYHKGTHPQSARLDEYFKEWLEALKVNEGYYQELVETIAPGQPA